MRKNEQAIENDDPLITEDDLTPELLEVLAKKGVTPAELERTFQQMKIALQALPDTMDTQELAFFIDRLLDAYEVAPAQRLSLLLGCASSIEGVTARVERVDRDAADEFTQFEECQCDGCRASRERKTLLN